MSFDALTALRNAGTPVDVLSDAQRAVFAGLTEAEVAVLNGLKTRLNEAGSEVEAHDVKIF